MEVSSRRTPNATLLLWHPVFLRRHFHWPGVTRELAAEEFLGLHRGGVLEGGENVETEEAECHSDGRAREHVAQEMHAQDDTR
jgi:hypothetical protein